MNWLRGPFRISYKENKIKVDILFITTHLEESNKEKKEMVSVSQSWCKSFPTIFLHVFKESLFWVLALVTSWLVLSRWWLPDLGSSKSVLVVAAAVFASSAVIAREMSRQKPLVSDYVGMVEKETESFSGSECINPSESEDWEAETDWGRCGRDWSEDGSITDEESLIEIAIPSGHSMGCWCRKEEDVCEIEEENLIEIDISMGSIKCTKGYELNRSS